MKHGDFTDLAKYYVNRPGYSHTVLNVLQTYAKGIAGYQEITVADIGAGTGKLTENLIELGLHGYAVEPNDAMRNEGVAYCASAQRPTPLPREGSFPNPAFLWSKGSAEHSGLNDCSADWVIMGSSFHWANTDEALMEFNRIIKNKGMFTAIYNPRDIEKNELHQTIEKKIKEIVPDLNRVSSGASRNVSEIEKKLLSSPHFGKLFFCEASHIETMTKERYLGAWLSVNDIQVQAGRDRWEKILLMIEKEISSLNVLEVPYKTRAWTVIKNG